MNQFKIEKGVPPPASSKNKGLTDALRKLKPGESVFLQGDKVGNVSSVVTRVKRENPSWLLVSRTVDGGARIWRIK